MTQPTVHDVLTVPVAPTLRERGIEIIRASLKPGARAEEEVEVYRSLVALAGEAQANPVVAQLDTIAKRAGVSRNRVRALLRHLEELHLLKAIRRTGDGHPLPNAWELYRPSKRLAGVAARQRHERDAAQLALAI